MRRRLEFLRAAGLGAREDEAEKCVGHEIPEGTPYDPMENLKELRRNYPNYGLYLAILGFKTQYPLLPEIWKQE